jgi:hypothetical protein
MSAMREQRRERDTPFRIGSTGVSPGDDGELADANDVAVVGDREIDGEGRVGGAVGVVGVDMCVVMVGKSQVSTEVSES